MLRKPVAAGGTVRPRLYAEGVKLAAGDMLVYASLGAGRVAAQEKRAGRRVTESGTESPERAGLYES